MAGDSKVLILLVEDSPIMRKMECTVLNSIGYPDIIEADNGEEAVAKILEGNKINLIISDWDMPKMSGFDFLVWLRAREEFNDIPFMMATGRGEKRVVKKALEAGANTFVTKPFGPGELKEKIEEALGLKKIDDSIPERVVRRSASGKVLIKAAHIQITDHVILGILKHMIATGKYTPQYFDLETECMSSWNPVGKALEKGTVDAAFVLAPIAMDLFSVGIPIKLVLLAHKSGSIFVRSKHAGKYEAPYKEFFRGKAFYIPHTMSIHHMLGHMFFEGIGLKPGLSSQPDAEVLFEVMPPVKMPEFLGKTTDSCGFLVAEPIGTKAIATGVAEQLFLSHELWENHPCCVVTMQDIILKEHPNVVYEFTEMLVKAGQFVDQNPGAAAEIAVDFLDPQKSLGLRVPLLKNVLTDPLGIKTSDLLPEISDLDKIQKYLHGKIGFGKLINLNEFVDLKYADAACKKHMTHARPGRLNNAKEVGQNFLTRHEADLKQESKTTLDKVGKYLTLSLGQQQFGIDISKIREIIPMTSFRTIPNSPPEIRGVINLRDKVLPVTDLRLRLGMKEVEYNERSCIIILEVYSKKGLIQTGIAVDSVSEVAYFKAEDIEDPPSRGLAIKTEYILAMAKSEQSVKILLDIDQVLKN